MNGVYDFISGNIKFEHGIGEEIPSSRLNSGLEDTTSYQSISTPLTGVGILGVDADTELFPAPGQWQQLDLWPLPTDEPV